MENLLLFRHPPPPLIVQEYLLDQKHLWWWNPPTDVYSPQCICEMNLVSGLWDKEASWPGCLLWQVPLASATFLPQYLSVGQWSMWPKGKGECLSWPLFIFIAVEPISACVIGRTFVDAGEEWSYVSCHLVLGRGWGNMELGCILLVA